jgi:hypothetical protein
MSRTSLFLPLNYNGQFYVRILKIMLSYFVRIYLDNGAENDFQTKLYIPVTSRITSSSF